MKLTYLLILCLLLSLVVTACATPTEENGQDLALSETTSAVMSTEAAIAATLPPIAEAEPTPPEPVLPEINYIRYQSTENYFELPLNGATGYAPISLNVRSAATSSSELLLTLEPGSQFLIIAESEDWWQVDIDGFSGYVYSPYCMINLPDVLPSVVYQNTNATSSVLRSSFTDIANLTGEQLYSAYEYNQRLGKEEFIMPVLYSMAQKIAHAQQLALAEGNTLIICELYRPHEVQQRIVTELTHLSHNNTDVLAGISTSPWTMGWFIATSISNHQRGVAMDTSLGKVLETASAYAGIYEYTSVIAYEDYIMQTPMHELSHRSTSLAYPVSSKNDTDWRNVPLAEQMTEGSILLRDYCTEAGLSPLASEWWHFNDLSAVGNALGGGDFYLSGNCSLEPIS